jgi:hypothetical protein
MERIWKEAIVPELGNCLQGLRKSTERLSQEIGLPAEI